MQQRYKMELTTLMSSPQAIELNLSRTITNCKRYCQMLYMKKSGSSPNFVCTVNNLYPLFKIPYKLPHRMRTGFFLSALNFAHRL